MGGGGPAGSGVHSEKGPLGFRLSVSTPWFPDCRRIHSNCIRVTTSSRRGFACFQKISHLHVVLLKK